MLLDLRLDEKIRRHSAQWIAEQVMVASRAARADLVREAAVVAEQSGEADTPEGRAVLSGSPRTSTMAAITEGAGFLIAAVRLSRTAIPDDAVIQHIHRPREDREPKIPDYQLVQ